MKGNIFLALFSVLVVSFILSSSTAYAANYYFFDTVYVTTPSTDQTINENTNFTMQCTAHTATGASKSTTQYTGNFLYQWNSTTQGWTNMSTSGTNVFLINASAIDTLQTQTNNLANFTLNVHTVKANVSVGTYWVRCEEPSENADGNTLLGSNEIQIKVPDTTPPTFSNNASRLVTTYKPNGYSNFSITWNDNSGSLFGAYLETNFTGSLQNSTMSGSYPNYFYNTTPLAAGTYIYRFVANDSAGNSNATAALTFTINKTSLAGTISVPTVTYPTGLNASGSETNIGDNDINFTLYCGSILMGSALNANPSGSFQFGTGNYPCVLNTSTGPFQNYTVNSSIATATGTVNKGILNGTITGASVNYPNPVNIIPYESNNGVGTDVNYTFWRNDTLVSSTTNGNPSADTSLLGSETYSWILNSTGGANWTSNSSIATASFTVNKGVLSGTLSTPTVIYPASLSASSTISNGGANDVTYQIFCGDNFIASAIASAPSDSLQFGGGIYACILNTTSGPFENYTANSSIAASPATVSPGVLNLAIIGSGVTYPSSVNIIPSESNNDVGTDVNYTLWRNDTLVSSANGTSPSADTSQLAAGTYNYIFNATGGQNWTANSTGVSLAVNVNQATPTAQILINGTDYTDQQFNTTNPATLNLTFIGNSLNNQLSWNIYQNGELIQSQNIGETSTTNISTYSPGFYAFKFNTSGDTNYTFLDPWVNITIISATFTLNLVSPNNVTTYPIAPIYFVVATDNLNDPFNLYAFINNTLFYSNTSYQNNTNITLPILDLAAGTYNLTVLVNDSTNSNGLSASDIFIVNQGTPMLSLDISPSNSTSYPTITTATGSIVTVDAAGSYNISLYRDGSLVDSTTSTSTVSEVILLGAGTYNYTLVYNGSENYTSAGIENDTIVNKGTPILSINSNVTSPITYPAASSVNGTGCPSELVCTLYRGNSSFSTTENDSVILGVGVYSYNYSTDSGDNWTSASATNYTLTVNKGVLSGSIAGSDVTYPAVLNVTPSENNIDGDDINYMFWRNDTLVSSANGTSPSADTSQLAAGTYVYVLNTTSGPFENYTANTSVATLTINVIKANATLDLLLNGTSSNITIASGGVVNATITAANDQGTIYLDINQVQVQSVIGTTLENISTYSGIPGSQFNITGYYPETQNYTASSKSSYIKIAGPANITIIKNSIGGDSTFVFTINGPSPSSPSITTVGGHGNTDFIPVNSGNYSISETVPSGWALINSSCDSGTPPNFSISLGESITCTFTNVKLGKIIVEKQTIPNGSSGIFRFVGDVSGTISDDRQIVFSNQMPGTYSSIETNPLPSFQLVNITCNDGNSTTPSTVDLATRKATINLDPGETVKCIFTNLKVGEIQGAKFEDKNGNGIRDDEDSGISGWTIYLDTNNNRQLDFGESSTITKSDGIYSFKGLNDGTYIVREIQKSGWTQTLPKGGNYTVGIKNGQANVSDVDFGNFKLASISGLKFRDTNGNGIRNADETRLSGWKVFIDSNNDGVFNSGEPNATTDGNGNYKFKDLAPGTYVIREVMKAGWTQTTPNQTVIISKSGASITGIDFGNKLGDIKGIKFNDSNIDGIKNDGEKGLQGWRIFIDKNNNGVLDPGEQSTTTNGNGEFSFVNLVPGTYTVREVQRPGFTQTAPASGKYIVKINDTVIINRNSATGLLFGNKKS